MPNLQIYKSPLDSSYCFCGRQAGSLEDYVFPEPLLGRKMLLDQQLLEQIYDTEFFEISPQELLGLLQAHIQKDHREQNSLVTFLNELKKKVYFDMNCSLNNQGRCSTAESTINKIFTIFCPVCNL